MSIYCYSTPVKQNWPWGGLQTHAVGRTNSLIADITTSLSAEKLAPVSRNGAPTEAEVLSLSPCFFICALTDGKTPDKALNGFLPHRTFLLKWLWAHKLVLVYDLTSVGFSFFLFQL